MLVADSDLTVAALPAANRILLLCLQLTDFYCFRLQLTDFYCFRLQLTDFYCFHLQPNRHVTAFLQRYKYKEELPEASYRA
jgi:hypothetical protein